MGLSLIDFFDNGVALDPSRPCLVCGDESVTYRGRTALVARDRERAHSRRDSAGCTRRCVGAQRRAAVPVRARRTSRGLHMGASQCAQCRCRKRFRF